MSKRNPLPRTPAIFREVEKLSPIHKEGRGVYLQVAVPNEAGRDFRGRPIPSFEKPYKLETDVLVTRPKDRARALEGWRMKYHLKEHKS